LVKGGYKDNDLKALVKIVERMKWRGTYCREGVEGLALSWRGRHAWLIFATSIDLIPMDLEDNLPQLSNLT
jgi:hypothetical protein